MFSDGLRMTRRDEKDGGSMVWPFASCMRGDGLLTALCDQTGPQQPTTRTFLDPSLRPLWGSANFAMVRLSRVHGYQHMTSASSVVLSEKVCRSDIVCLNRRAFLFRTRSPIDGGSSIVTSPRHVSWRTGRRVGWLLPVCDLWKSHDGTCKA